MTWANFDDNFADHPKTLGLSDGAFRLHVSAILYCSRHLTDGFVPKVKAPRLTPNYKPSHLRELLQKGLWQGAGDEYELHDYLEWNRSRESIVSERARKSEAGRRGAKRRWGQ